MNDQNKQDLKERAEGQSRLNLGLVALLPCPFCGKPADLDDDDTLYPSGTGWLFNEELQMRTYHRHIDTPQEQWCYTMHCPVPSGGCGAEMPGDTRSDALNRWNKRPNAKLTSGALTAPKPE